MSENLDDLEFVEYELPDDGWFVYVIPYNDLIEHKFIDYPCNPVLSEGVFTHNSADGRELDGEVLH